VVVIYLRGKAVKVPNTVFELWNQTVSYLEQRNTKGRSQVGIYLNFLTPKNLSDRELVVSTGNTFAKDWIERHYFSDIKDAIFNVAGIDYDFRIVVSGKDSPSQTTYQQSLSKSGATQTMTSQSGEQAPSLSILTGPFSGNTPASTSSGDMPVSASTGPLANPISIPTIIRSSTPDSPGRRGWEPEGETADEQSLNPTFFTSASEPLEARTAAVSDERTFDSFVVGDSNHYAFSAALGVAKSPGNIYNPLFIYGKSGLGKTHLLLAIENYIHSHHPHLKTTYAQTSDLVRDFTSMFYNDGKKHEFELKYHDVDVILFDDVQSLEGKIETTNEVFQIFNHFTTQNKQIILSADRAPYNIDLDTRYKSRFASGPTIDIQPPTFETKQTIFENYFDYCCRKIERMDLKEIITQEITERIIELSTDNIRELEGATASLVAYLSARQDMFSTLTVEEVERQISNVFMRSVEKRVDIDIIQKEIENYYKISHEDLIGQQRSQGISYPRQIAMYLSRSMTDESYPDIGKAFGGKDHTTVMYACNKIEKRRQLSREMNQEIEKLVSLLRK
jgi:chromosomal replication initiator protein